MTTYGEGKPDPVLIEAERQRRQREALQEAFDAIADIRDGRPILTQKDAAAETFIQQMKLRSSSDPIARKFLRLARRTDQLTGGYIADVIELMMARNRLATQDQVRIAAWRTPINDGRGGGHVVLARHNPKGWIGYGCEFIGTGYDDGRQKFEQAAAGVDVYFEFPF